MNDFIEEVLLSNDEIVNISKKLGEQISKDYEGKKPLLVGLLKGSVPFMAELMKHIDIEMEIDFMKASSYSGTHSTGTVTITRDTTTNMEGRHVLLVEDIVDTGLTLREVKNLLKDRGALSIKIVTLLDKPSSRPEGTVIPGYVGAIVPAKFVVGFGLDYNELYRNLPYVGVLKRTVYEK